MRIFIISCLALVAYAANAQTITDELRRDKAGQGHVVINQSAEIERLVNGTPVPQVTGQTEKVQKSENNEPKKVQGTTVVVERSDSHATATTPKTAEKPSEQPDAGKSAATSTPASPTPPTEKPAAKRVASTTNEATEGEAAVVNTNKKIMRHSYKATGYRIQAYSGGNKREDRTKCEQIGARIKATFPDMPIYVHFYSPSWKCRVGNFTDMNEAKQVLKKIKAMGYSQACLVKGTINVQY